MKIWFEKLLTWAANYLVARAVNSPTPTDEIKVVEIVRLRPDVMQRLEHEVGAIYMSPTTTELMAAYQLGVQATLKKLRDGYAID